MNRLLSMHGTLVHNQDNGASLGHGDTTCRDKEQWEWFRVWHDVCDRTHERRENDTRGLRGTNLITRIPDEATLEEVLPTSPSLKRRRRPENHPVAADAWAAKLHALAD